MNNTKKQIHYQVILLFLAMIVVFSPLSYGDSILNKESFLEELSTIRNIVKTKSLKYLIELIPLPYIVDKIDENNLDITYARIIFYKHYLQKESYMLRNVTKTDTQFVAQEDIERSNPGYFDDVQDQDIKYMIETINSFLFAQSIASQNTFFHTSHHKGFRINKKNYKKYPSIIKTYMIPYYVIHEFTSSNNDVLESIQKKMLHTTAENRINILEQNAHNIHIQIKKRNTTINEIKRNLIYDNTRDDFVNYVSPIFSNTFYFIEKKADKTYLYDKYLPYVITFRTLEGKKTIENHKHDNTFYHIVCSTGEYKDKNINIYDLGWHLIQDEVKFKNESIDYSTILTDEIVYDSNHLLYKVICDTSLNNDAINYIQYMHRPLVLYNDALEKKYNIENKIQKFSQYIR